MIARMVVFQASFLRCKDKNRTRNLQIFQTKKECRNFYFG